MTKPPSRGSGPSLAIVLGPRPRARARGDVPVARRGLPAGGRGGGGSRGPAGGRERGRRGDRHGLRAGGDPPGGGEHRRGRVPRRLPGRVARGRDGRLPRDGAPGPRPSGCTSAPTAAHARPPGGARAAGVPGTVRGLGLAHAKWGKAPWADLVRPAAKLAREGFPVSATLASSLNAQLFAGQGPTPGGRPRRPGPAGRPARRLRRVGRRLPQARRLALGRGRPPGPARPGRHPRPDRRQAAPTSSTPARPPGRSSPTWRSSAA